MSIRIFRAGALPAFLSLASLLLAAAAGHAQTPSRSAPQATPTPPPASSQPKPVTGFVSSYEIMRTVRSAGFDLLSPPLREGTTYVLRATDFRGILMRVVLDARTGVIRDVTRIVPAAAGPYGTMPPPYGPPPYVSPPYGPPPYGPPPYASPPYGPPPYGSPAEYDIPAPGMGPAEEGATPPLSQPAVLPTVIRPAVSAHTSFPPLPRPRPALAGSKKTERPEKTGKVKKPAARDNFANAPPPAGTNANAIGVNAGAASAPSASSGKAPLVVPLND